MRLQMPSVQEECHIWVGQWWWENLILSHLPPQAGSGWCMFIPVLRQYSPMSCWNSAHMLSHDLVLLFRAFLSTAWLSSDFTDYKNTFKKQVFTQISFMGCRIQHRLSERYLAAGKQDSHQNKDHKQGKTNCQARRHGMTKLSGQKQSSCSLCPRGTPGRTPGT